MQKISLVKRAAVRDSDDLTQPMRFLVTKQDQGDSWSLEVPIVKADASRHFAYGVALAPEQLDSQGDVISAEDVEFAAHHFLLGFTGLNRGADGPPMNLQHGPDVKAAPIESYIAPQDMIWDTLSGPRTVTMGSWVITSWIPDEETWAMVERGEITGFSIEGYGSRERKQESRPEPLRVLKQQEQQQAAPMSAIDAEVALLREQVPEWTEAAAVGQVLREHPSLYAAYKQAGEVAVAKAETVVGVARADALRQLERLTGEYLASHRAAPGKPAPTRPQAFAAILDTDEGQKWWKIYAGR